MIEDIGIIDTRKIINTIKEYHGIDFSEYSLTSLKRRIIRAIEETKINSIDSLLQILNNKDFIESFLNYICVDTTEMFRDPSVWRRIKKDILAKSESHVTFKIWFPDAGSGEEIYSLAILLRELGISNKVKIFASSLSSQKIDFIKKGVYKQKREDVNTANFERIKSSTDLSDYCKKDGITMYMDTTLLDNVEFIKSKSLIDSVPEGLKLVIFRNSMIYLNKSYQNLVVEKISDSMLTGGYLIIGIKENLNSILAEKKFKLIDESERVFQKILV